MHDLWARAQCSGAAAALAQDATPLHSALVNLRATGPARQATYLEAFTWSLQCRSARQRHGHTWPQPRGVHIHTAAVTLQLG